MRLTLAACIAITILLARGAEADNYPALITGEWEKANFKGELPYRIFGGRNIEAGKKYPLVIFLHGRQRRGGDNEKHLTGEPKCFAYPQNYKQRPCFIIAPQCPNGKTWAGPIATQVIELIKEVVEKLPVDQRRIYITGYSMGGYGTWNLLRKEPALFAAAVPVAGGGDPKVISIHKHVPTWVFHGEKDLIVNVSQSQEMVSALKSEAGNIKYTEFKNVGHIVVSKKVYLDENVHRWLFHQKRKE